LDLNEWNGKLFLGVKGISVFAPMWCGRFWWQITVNFFKNRKGGEM